MKKKINRSLAGIAIFTIVITAFVMTVLFYEQIKKQVFSDLEDIASLISSDSFPENTRKYENSEKIRITIVGDRGEVLYDSIGDVSKMENHLERPEIKLAKQNGAGISVRNSDTLSESVFYYAMRLDDGQILRVGKEADSVWSMLISVIPSIIIITVILAMICFFLSRYITRIIVNPIYETEEHMDSIDESLIYEELQPFIRRISTQHEEILAAANMRQEFTANVTHELKTPLAAISGYAELMESGIVDEKDIIHFSTEIRKSAARLLTLINDIIKLSQLDSGNVDGIDEYVDIAQIAKETVSMLSIGAKKNDITLEYIGDDDARVRIGKEMAQEITYNLIENAIRYNKPNGSVTVSVCKDAGKIIFTVKDTGIGIPKIHQERIFERFYRVDKSRSKELGGTGLGLAIVKHICTLTKARLQLESLENVGTTVSVIWDE